MPFGDPYVGPMELADFLKMTVDTNDLQLALAVSSASRWLEGYCGRQFNLDTSTSARYFDTHDDKTVNIDDVGDATFTVATDTNYDGTYVTTLGAADFQAKPFNAIPTNRAISSLIATRYGFYFPSFYGQRQGLIRVTAKWGWPIVPPAVKEACLIQAGHLYKRRESTEGVMGFNSFGPVRVGTRIDPDVEALLADFRFGPACA